MGILTFITILCIGMTLGFLSVGLVLRILKHTENKDDQRKG